MSRNWIAVASAEHVRLGRSQGFMQVCHGKAAPLRRIHPGDLVAYYSPTTIFRSKEPLRAFTAVGIVREGEPYQVDMGEGFCPYRRDVNWLPANEANIYPLLDRMKLTAGKKNWGAAFRYGVLEVEKGDMEIIANAMGVTFPQ